MPATQEEKEAACLEADLLAISAQESCPQQWQKRTKTKIDLPEDQLIQDAILEVDPVSMNSLPFGLTDPIIRISMAVAMRGLLSVCHT